MVNEDLEFERLLAAQDRIRHSVIRVELPSGITWNLDIRDVFKTESAYLAQNEEYIMTDTRTGQVISKNLAGVIIYAPKDLDMKVV